MVLQPQAFIDDSVTPSGKGFFVLGGFVAPAASWASFSDDWQAVLDLPPKLDYFKMNEANLLIGQFSEDHGWNETKRDNRLLDFADVIKKHAPLGIFASARQSDFEEAISSVPLPDRSLATDSPYIYLVIRLMVGVMVRGRHFGINEPCDFIFDEQFGYAEEIFLNWEAMKKTAERPPNPPTVLGSKPQFRNDKEFLPLQAADLFASQVRYSFERNSGKIIVPPTKILRKLLDIPRIESDSSEEDLQSLRRKVLEIQQAIVRSNPNSPLIHFAKTARERRLNRKASRKKSKKKPSSSPGRRSF